MTLQAPTTVESFGPDSEEYHRVYIPAAVRSDSKYPFDAEQDLTVRVVGPALVLVPSRQYSLARRIGRVVTQEVL